MTEHALLPDHAAKLMKARGELEWALGEHGWMADGPAVQSVATAALLLLEVLEEQMAPEPPEGRVAYPPEDWRDA